MLAKQYTVLLLLPFYISSAQCSQQDFVTPVGHDNGQNKEINTHSADTVILTATKQRQKKKEHDEIRRNLAFEFQLSGREEGEKDKRLPKEDDGIKPWKEFSPCPLTQAVKIVLPGLILEAEQKIKQKGHVSAEDSHKIKSLIKFCKTNEGSGEWALYHSLAQGASGVFRMLLDKGYSYQVFFPKVKTKIIRPDGSGSVEGILIAALRLGQCEHVRILIDHVDHFSFFSEQVDRSNLTDADWGEVIASLEVVQTEAEKSKDDDLLQLCLYLLDLIKRKQQGALRYYASAMYRSIWKDLSIASSEGKSLATTLVSYAPFLAMAGFMGVLFIRDVKMAQKQ